MVQISCRRIAATWLSIIAVLHACRGQDIDVSGCGETKGCFQTPEGCDAASCEFLLTWTAAGDDSVFFEMSAPVDSQNSYVAFGLSQDALMGSDSVIACLYDQKKGRVDIEASWNTGSPKRNRAIPNPKLGIVASGQSGSLDNNRISCSFKRVKQVNPSKEEFYDISAGSNYYILMATGSVSAVSGRKTLRQHSKRVASNAAVDLTTVEGVVGDEDAGKTKRLLTKVHGILMVIAWCIFANVGVLMPRYYKPTWSGRTWCGKAIWFQIHRPCMTMTLLATAAAFIIIFVAVRGYSDLPSPGVAHPPLGICVMALVLINPLMALCRPAPDASKRWVFNLFHFLVGFLAQLAAATAVFLGLWQFGLPYWLMIIMAALLAFHALIELILIFHKICKCCGNKKDEKRSLEEVEMERLDHRQRKPKASTSSKVSDVFKTVIMFIHMFGVTGFTVVMAVKIGMHGGPYRLPDIVSTLE